MNQNDCFRALNTELPKNIADEKALGNFKKAQKLIDRRLKEEGLTENLRSSLLLQREIMNRLPMDYTYSFEEAFEEVCRRIPDFTREELQQYIDERRFSTIYIDGKIAIFNRFISVLEKYEDFRKRLKDTEEFILEDWQRVKTVREMKENGKLSKHITIRQTLKIKDDAFINGEEYLIHLPIPCRCSSQSEIRIEKVYPEGYVIDEEDNKARTIYWKKRLEKNEEFLVEYSYLSSFEYVALDKGSVEGTYDFDVMEEEPHVVFSKLVKDTADEITRGCKDPLSKAKAIYDYMTLNMKYSFQPSYFVMGNIVEECLRSLRGDCGIFALTFITLCRSVGIPAHFESSKSIDEDGVGSHDWARFYIEPYGWLYADVSFGIGSHNRHYEEGRQYYFGNLDPYRMIANESFQYDLSGNKKYWRNDPYDNQTGEVEDSQRGYIRGIDYDSDAVLVSMD